MDKILIGAPLARSYENDDDVDDDDERVVRT